MRAWRIHTPGRIPSGRTDGRVAGRVFDQYEYVHDNNVTNWRNKLILVN